MATASVRMAWWAAFAVVAAVAVPVAVLRGSSGTEPDGDLLRVRSTSQFAFTSLVDMAAASDLVIEGVVTSTEKGRVVGAPTNDDASAGIVTRTVLIDVERVLGNGEINTLAGGTVDSVVVEEEGWLTDGTAIQVDDLRPSEVGMRGVWFLDRIEGEEAPRYLVINSQGRLLDAGGVVEGGLADDSLVHAAEQAPYADLVNALAAVVAPQP
jgi:hypothetical protein